MTFDPEKNHRRSLRIKNRDYSRDGYYFVTICTRNRENIFADFCVGVGLAPTPNSPDKGQGQPQGNTNHPPISADAVCLPPQGRLPLHKENTPTLFLTTVGQIVEKNWRKITDRNVKTDAFVIMPNHIHGIIIIKPHALGIAGLAPAPDSPVDNDHGRPRGAPLQQKNAPSSTLGSIIGAFKSRCALEYLKFIDDNDLNESGKFGSAIITSISSVTEMNSSRSETTSNPIPPIGQRIKKIQLIFEFRLLVSM